MPFGLRCRVLAAIDSLMTVSHRNPLHDPDAVLQRLHGLRPISAKQKQSSFERGCERYARLALMISGGLFAALLVLALWHLAAPLPRFGVWTAQILALLCMALSLLSIIVNSLPGLALILCFHRLAQRDLLKELEHDRLQAALLRPYRQSALEQAAQALQDKQEQAGSRIGALIGSHEQLALFSIAGFALAVWEKLSDQGSALNRLFQFSIPYSHWNGHDLLMLALAGVAGFLLGGVLLKAVLHRRAYQLALLRQAIADKTRRRDARRRRFGPRA